MVLYPTWAQDGQALCTRKGQLSPWCCVLAITLQLQVVTCCCPLRTSAQPCTALPQAPGSSGFAGEGCSQVFLNAAQEARDGAISVAASSSPARASQFTDS